MANQRLCLIDGCSKPARTRGWCKTHYMRWLRHGDCNSRPARVRGACSVEGCENPHSAKGFCGAHYHKWVAHGDPCSGRNHRRRGSTQAFIQFALNEHVGDDCLIWPFQRNQKGYPVVTIGEVRTTASRYICEQYHGKAPADDYQAAHSCGNGHLGCVNRRHLRWATVSENHLDKRAHGTDTAGEASNFAKLSEADVRQIRELRPTTRVKDLAKRFGCSTGNIWVICAGKSWRGTNDRNRHL